MLMYVKVLTYGCEVSFSWKIYKYLKGHAFMYII